MIYFNEKVKLAETHSKILLKRVKKMLRYLDLQKKDLSITFCGNPYIRKLNKQYRQKDKATDVLSFPMDDDKLLGDIIISLVQARANCRLVGTTFLAELTFLIVHGVCHLLGYDHQTPKQEKRMQALETKLLNAVNEI